MDPQRDSAFVQGAVRSCCTVLIMCPTMSLVASILFNVILGGMPVVQLPAIWVGTLIKNFPMVLLWNLFAAGPVSRLAFERLFSRVGMKGRTAGVELEHEPHSGLAPEDARRTRRLALSTSHTTSPAEPQSTGPRGRR